MHQHVANHNGKIGLSDAAMVTNYRSTLRAARANHVMETLLTRLSTGAGRAARNNKNAHGHHHHGAGGNNGWHVNEDHIDMADAVLAHDYLANVWSAQLLGSMPPPAAPTKATATGTAAPLTSMVGHTPQMVVSGGTAPTPSTMVARTGDCSWLTSGFPLFQYQEEILNMLPKLACPSPDRVKANIDPVRPLRCTLPVV